MLIQYLLQNPLNTLTSVVIGVLTLGVVKLIKFYLDARPYPPGPVPLPLLGNVLEFKKRKSTQQLHEVITDLRFKHGPVFTFWMSAWDPQVVITKPELVKEALTRFQFADWGREWEVLRKVSHTAVRKFSVSERLPPMVDRAVETLWTELREYGNQPFDLEEHLTFLMMSLLANIAYSKQYTRDDEDFNQLKKDNELQTQSSKAGLLIIFPMLRFVWRKEWRQIVDVVDTQVNFTNKQFEEHLASFEEGTINDFTDAMISAIREAEAEDSSDKQYLKTRNIINTLRDLFAAGSETTKTTLQWIILFLAVHQDHQQAIREEVEAALGSDDIITLEHRHHCNLLQAFIYESMRIRPVVPANVPHKAILDTKLGGFKIKKGTTVIIPIEPLSISEEVWVEPRVFKPERFLTEDRKFNPRPNAYFAPFGGGRRSCLGEKLALANTFMVVAGLLHRSRDLTLALSDDSRDLDLTPDPNRDASLRPRSHKLIFKPKG